MKTIVGFGDSFIRGSEIDGNDDGSLAWPGQVAQQLGANYVTYGLPGCGNDAIARQIYSHFSKHTAQDTLVVINWTWSMRWDFYIAKGHETWITLGPTCVPKKLQHLVDVTQSERLIEFYTNYANDSIHWNKIRNLQTIFAAQQYMKLKGVKSIQTYMDYHLFDQQWHAPDYIQELQYYVRPEMQDWEGHNFIDWCYSKGYEVTQQGLHPLLPAHTAAAEFWKETYAQALA